MDVGRDRASGVSLRGESRGAERCTDFLGVAPLPAIGD